MEQQLVPISRFLSYLLRHRPEAEGLSMDEHGWIVIADLLAAQGAKKMGLTQAVLTLIVAENDKQRFEVNEEGDKIRARQGHSKPVSLGWRPVKPPDFLYHGTSSHAISSIRLDGLLKRHRLHVHLSPDAVTAKLVGARHGRPVVLVIRAGEMHKKGIDFFLSGNGVWLTESVPPQFIDFP